MSRFRWRIRRTASRRCRSSFRSGRQLCKVLQRYRLAPCPQRQRQLQPQTRDEQVKHRSFEVILLSFVALALLATPAWFVWASAVPEPVAPDPFEQAGLDVLRPTQDDIFDGLVPLVAGTPGLYFSEGEHPEWILVAQLTTSAGYERYLDKEKKLANDIWVTPVPQVMDSCRNFGAGDVPVETRLRQYLA